jgi:4-amino-4-deoxy-L-arabinose transferase-like glycosyltransferase
MNALESDIDAPPSRSRLAQRSSYLIAIGGVLLLCGFLKIPSLFHAHDENDEIIYLTVAQNLWTTGHYSLRGAWFLPALPPYMYDRELFHYPPLFPVLLMPFVALRSLKYAVLVSWLGHFLCVIAVALIGGRSLTHADAKQRISFPLFFLALLGVALDPFLTFFSRRIWIDSMLAGLTSLALALFYVGTCGGEPVRRWRFALGGLVLALAMLAKPTAALAAPLIALLIYTSRQNRLEKAKSLLLAFAPAVLLMTPWFVVYYQTFGTLSLEWVKPDAELQAKYLFVRLATERPPYYYVKKLLLLQPLALVLGVFLASHAHVLRRREVWFPLIWLLGFLAPLTWVSATGFGFQTRHVACMYPAVYLMAFSLRGLPDESRDRWSVFLAICVVYAAISGSMCLPHPDPDEIKSMLEVVGLVS